MKLEKTSRDLKLLDKLKDRTATVGIIGLGRVGLPLAVSLGEAGFQKNWV